MNMSMNIHARGRFTCTQAYGYKLEWVHVVGFIQESTSRIHGCRNEPKQYASHVAAIHLGTSYTHDCGT